MFQKPVSSTAPAPAPVPTASTKQENKHDDNQNRFQTHSEVFLSAALVFEKFDRWRLEQSVQKRTQLNLTVLDLHLGDADPLAVTLPATFARKTFYSVVGEIC